MIVELAVLSVLFFAVLALNLFGTCGYELDRYLIYFYVLVAVVTVYVADQLLTVLAL